MTASKYPRFTPRAIELQRGTQHVTIPSVPGLSATVFEDSKPVCEDNGDGVKNVAFSGNVQGLIEYHLPKLPDSNGSGYQTGEELR